jgi:hypothetical protein
MTIRGLRILPPFAIGRFGSSSQPLEAYSLQISTTDPLDFREIVPEKTLEVDPTSGAVTRAYTPTKVRFRDGEHIRPVAPFLEVFALTESDTLVPLTLDLLRQAGVGAEAVRWSVDVANLKVYRQTHVKADKILASLDEVADHEIHELRGRADNFLKDKHIPFGTVRYVRPTPEFPEIRLRFTPPQGIVYGSSKERRDPETGERVVDPVFVGAEDRIVYDATRGKWLDFRADATSNSLPNPSDIYQGYWPETEPLPVGWGYLDDVCDGRISVKVVLGDGTTLQASAWISSCMPAFAPDSEPVRTVADDLEQFICGDQVADEEVSIDDAAELIRRALESIRLMNTAAMNANTIYGRTNIASTLYRQDANDYGRLWAPGMAASLVDNLAVRALHERIYAALVSGSAPWFAEVLRQPEEVGDLSDKARRKMPPMLRGADGRALALTRRQISKVVRAVAAGLFDGTPSAKEDQGK